MSKLTNIFKGNTAPHTGTALSERLHDNLMDMGTMEEFNHFFTNPNAFAMNIKTDDEMCQVSVDLPEDCGIEELKTEVRDGCLVLERNFDKHLRKDTEDGTYECRNTQQMFRSVSLPYGCMGERMKKEVENNKLIISIPRHLEGLTPKTKPSA